MAEVKTARQLASDITQSGAKLYDLMENEFTERVERARALRFLDQAASTSGMHLYCRMFDFSMSSLLFTIILVCTVHLLHYRYVCVFVFVCISDGPREQAYIERSIRDIIENTKQQLEDVRFVLLMKYLVVSTAKIESFAKSDHMFRFC